MKKGESQKFFDVFFENKGQRIFLGIGKKSLS
jgi:hypothetical protein